MEQIKVCFGFFFSPPFATGVINLMFHQRKKLSLGDHADSKPPPFLPAHPLSPFTVADSGVPTPSPHLAGSLVAQFLGDGVEGFQLGSLLLAGGEDDSVSLPGEQ